MRFATGKDLRRKLLAGESSVPDRAFIFAELASNVDWDDGIAVTSSHLCHPGSAVFGALLALMDEDEPLQSDRFLKSAFVGYAAAAKWAQEYNDPESGRYSIAGPPGAIGATAAAAAYLGYPIEQAVQALRLAEDMGAVAPSSGALRSGATETKELLSHSAAVGVRAAIAAANGSEGHLCVLESANFRTHPCSEDSIDASVYVKPYPACRFLHPTLDAIRALGVLPAPGLILGIEIRTPAAPSVFDRKNPIGPYERQFSIPYTVMCLIRDGMLSPESFFERGCSIDDRNLVDRIDLTADSTLGEYGCFHAARVRISLEDGRSLEAFCPQPAGANSTREHVLEEKWRYASRPLGFSGSIRDLEKLAVTPRSFLDILK